MNKFKSFVDQFKLIRKNKVEDLVKTAIDDANGELIEKIRGFSEFDAYFSKEGTDFLSSKEVLFNEAFTKNKVKNPEVKDILLNAFDNVPSIDLTFEELYMIQDAIWTKYGYDPLIQGAVDNYVDYVIGGGVSTSTPVEDVNKVLEDFARRNKWQERQRAIVKNGFIDGEHFTMMFTNANGEVHVRKCHPRSIESMETAKTDYEVLFSIYRRLYSYDGQGGGHYSDAQQRVKTLEYDDLQKAGLNYNQSLYVKDFVPNAAVSFLKFNDSDKLRGLPPLRRVLKWSKLYENFIMDRMVLNHERAKVVWIKTYGMKPRDPLPNKPYKSPPQGSMMIEKDGIKYRTEKPNLDSSEAKEDGLGLLYYIATSVRMPLHILNQRTDQQVYASSDLLLTQFLTNKGWKYLKDINKEQDLAGTMNPDTHKFEWQKINGKTEYEHEGDMYHIKSSASDLLCTPNHDLYVAGGSSTKSKRILKNELKIEHFNKKRADEAYHGNMHWTVCQLNWDDSQKLNFNNSDQKIPSFTQKYPEQYYDWLRFIGFYIGDGSINFSGFLTGDEIPNNTKGAINISQTRKDGVQYLVSLAGSLDLNINFAKKEGKDRYTFSILRSYPDSLIISHWFKDNCGHGSYNKKIPDFIFGLSRKEQEIFFEGLMMSDGSKDSKPGRTNMTYSTRSEQLSEDVFMLTLKLGYRSRIITQQMAEIRYIRGRRIKDGKIKYHVKFVDSGGTELLTNQRNNIEKIENYKGRVGCINVDNGLIVTRSNGKIAIHGNSIRKADTPFQQMIEASQYMFAGHFEDIYRFQIKEMVKRGKLKKEYEYSSYAEDAVLTAARQINRGVLDKRPIEDIKNEVKKTLDDGKFQVLVPTEELPISQDFPQMMLQDPKEMAEVLKTHKETGLASVATLSGKAGYTWKKEFPKIMAEFAINLENQKKTQEVVSRGKEDENNRNKPKEKPKETKK